MFRIISAFLLVFFAIASTTLCTAQLVDKGGGLIYDTAQNVTWTQTADPMGVNFVHPKDGLTFPEVMSRLTTFTYGGYDGWRLPTGPTDTANLTGGEFYNLYRELGNSGTGTLTYKGPFIQLSPGWYWTGGEVPPAGSGYGYVFDWYFGSYVGGSNRNTQDLAIWLVHDGELTYNNGGDDGGDDEGDDGNVPVPEPGTLLLLSLGAGLLQIKRVRR